MQRMATCVAVLPPLPHAASADIITFEPPTSSGVSCAPFTCGRLLRYQQIYSADLFSVELLITEIVFPTVASGTILPLEFTVTLSTTTRAVDGLTIDLASNVGTSPGLFFGGRLSGTLASDFALVGLMPYLYDPTAGNLLLDVVIDAHYLQPQGGTATFDARVGAELFSRASLVQFNTGQFTGVAAEGVVTSFVTAPIPAPVPEPSSLVLMWTGVAALALSRRRR